MQPRPNDESVSSQPWSLEKSHLFIVYFLGFVNPGLISYTFGQKIPKF